MFSIISHISHNFKKVIKAANVSIASITSMILICSSLSSISHAGDINAGKAKFTQVCAACHGADARKTTDNSYPQLAGQYEDYIIRALEDYRSGARKNASMNGVAQPTQFSKGLSHADIKNLAAYLSSLPSNLQVEVKK